MKKVVQTLLVAFTFLGLQQVQADEAKAVKADFFNVADIATIHEVEPAYPKLAMRTGVEGYVILSYNLDASGKPIDIKVVEEHPRRVFAEAAIRALKASRYEVVDQAGTAYVVKGLARRYDFQFPEELMARTARR
ncbi:energy transducer TonB [Halioxenophilus sp. WMMB6]|uniref:energy transducer TonB n=1 Tax=Halioxenophilus sp. WMMB6 TaxID=3073815 RepID=UPI00295EFEB7|nr:energy transducer TonB [Halioxenophilus sp. WMMB6]